jgi:2-hydroxy-6-oxonona-2,4-dienedioate hydrolase
MKKETLTLNDNDPGVIAARNAEQQLFHNYGLAAKDRYILLPEQHIKVRVSEIGTGRPVLIVPGNTGDVFPLASLLAQLRSYRIIALNRPGGGLSEGMDHTTVDIRRFAVQTIITVLDAFQIESIDIIAHSIGAHWSLWTAMDQPHRVRTLTLLGNPGNVMKGRPPFIMRLMVKPPLNKLFFRLIASSNKDKALKTLKFMGHSNESISRQPKALGDCFFYFRKLPHYLLSLTSLMENGAPQIDEKQLKQVQQPVEFLLGDKDNFISVEGGKSIAASIPDCAFHIIKGTGHLPWMENPEESGSLIKDFLNRN